MKAQFVGTIVIALVIALPAMAEPATGSATTTNQGTGFTPSNPTDTMPLHPTTSPHMKSHRRGHKPLDQRATQENTETPPEDKGTEPGAK